MNIKVTVYELDEQMKFLREQAERLREVAARPGGGRWAETNARKMDDISRVLEQLLREMQMTTMSGKRIE